MTEEYCDWCNTEVIYMGWGDESLAYCETCGRTVEGHTYEEVPDEAE